MGAVLFYIYIYICTHIHVHVCVTFSSPFVLIYQVYIYLLQEIQKELIQVSDKLSY